MVKRIISLFQKEISGLHEAAYLLALFAFLSQLLALARDRLLASSFGAGEALDLYYAAFRIPDFIFVAIGSLVSVSVLIPFLAERLEQGVAAERRFINGVFTLFAALIVAVSIIAYVLMPKILPFIFPGFTDNQFGPLTTLARILLLSPIFLGFSNLFGSIVQTHRRFVVYALSPLLYNFGIIFGIIYLVPRFGIKGVVYGVVLGALAHMLIQVPFVVKQKLWPRLVLWRQSLALSKLVKLSIPRTITLSVNHLATLVMLSFASLMSAGSIAVFNLSFNLQSVPLTIIGVSYSLAAFPTLSKLFTGGNTKEFSKHLITSARHIIFWSLPLAVLFIVLRAQIVRTVLGAGEFSWSDTRLAAAALALFAVTAVFQCLILLFVRAFYAAGQTKKPLIINVIANLMALGGTYGLIVLFKQYQTFSYFVESLLRVSDVPGTEVLMLPLGFSIGALINALWLWCSLESNIVSFSRPVIKTFFQAFSAAVIMGAVSYLGLEMFDDLFDLTTLVGIFSQGLLAGLLGIIAGVVVLILLKNQEVVEMWQTVHRKFWRVQTITPEQDLL